MNQKQKQVRMYTRLGELAGLIFNARNKRDVLPLNSRTWITFSDYCSKLDNA